MAPGIGTVCGDIAWGGNWFFLVQATGRRSPCATLEELTDFAWRIRQGLDSTASPATTAARSTTSSCSGRRTVPGADSKNFVLCPGKAYDRSPCGTGTSAKLACLYADGKLAPGQVWRQESIVGSIFEGRSRWWTISVYPEITGSAYVNAEADLILDDARSVLFRHSRDMRVHATT